MSAQQTDTHIITITTHKRLHTQSNNTTEQATTDRHNEFRDQAVAVFLTLYI